ncbi:MAG: hypothetical protein WKG00_35905 [Polyangiaceae bacterium]
MPAAGPPIPPEEIARAVNPKGEPPYSGPTGTLRGVIRIKGDPPPATGLSFPTDKCPEAAAAYGKLFRVGQDRTLADAMVSVTEYEGFVPAKEEAARLEVKGCAFVERTLVATFGQRVEVVNKDKLESYLPYLDGAKFRAMLVAVPGGDAVKYYPHQPGHYMLRDQLPKPWLTADVFVLKYATHDVTGLDGAYEIRGIPVGKVHVDAFLPPTGGTVGQAFEIKEGDNKLDLTVEFDAAKLKKPGPATGSKPGGPAASKPAASGSKG